MKRFAMLVLASLLLAPAWAQADLPPDDIVGKVLREAPEVRAARSLLGAGEAERRRLQAGMHEWMVRWGGQARRVSPVPGPNERFSEWNAAIERPFRLPGKGATDEALGDAAVALAETGYGDALHEASRGLLKAWFDWLRESAALDQWQQQVALLQQQAKAVTRRQQLGDAARVEAVQAEAARSQAEAQLAASRARQRVAEDLLRRRYPGLSLNMPARISEPAPLEGDEASWVAATLAHSHEMAMARQEASQAQLVATRKRQDRLPDPTVGVHYSRERGGEENVTGLYLSIPLPGGARRAEADFSVAHAAASGERAAAVERRLASEGAALYQSAQAGVASWQAARDSARNQGEAADMTARAYALGEGSLNELLLARRLANEARLAARQTQLDALEARYRLLLDAHRLWDLD